MGSLLPQKSGLIWYTRNRDFDTAIDLKVLTYNLTAIYDHLHHRSLRKIMDIIYNRLWKLLIDKRMTKTEMRRAAGISTNILAKMGKDEPVAMETLAKIATALECGFDDIVEISTEN